MNYIISILSLGRDNECCFITPIDYIRICICLYISGKVSSRGMSGVRRSDLFINKQFMAGNLFINYQLVEKYALQVQGQELELVIYL